MARQVKRPAGALLAGLVLLAACGRRPAAGRDTIEISIPDELDTLDPHARDWAGSFSLLSHFYEPLVTTDAGLAIHPALAVRWDNPDPLTWVFHLQPGARFHSGRLLDADDVVASLERLRTRPGLEMSRNVAGISEVRARDVSTVEVKTGRPTSLLLSRLRFLLVVPKGMADAALASTVDGTGPYLLADWTGDTLRMTRNPGYWGKAPPFSGVTFRLKRSPLDAIADLRSGGSQFAECDSRNLDAALRQLTGFQTRHQSSLFVKFLGFDTRREATPFCSVRPNPFRNRLVRRAIHLALDRSALVEHLSTFAVPATQLVPPFIFGFNPAIGSPVPDRNRARTLLAEAGLPNGFEVTLHTRRILAETAGLVREMLAPIGIRVKVEVFSDPEFFDTGAREGLTFYLMRYGCPTGDASLVLENAIHSVETAKHLGGVNYGRFASPELDREIEESAEVMDMPARRQLLQHIMAHAMEDLALIPLYVDENVYAFSHDLTWQPRNDSYVMATEVVPAG